MSDGCDFTSDQPDSERPDERELKDAIRAVLSEMLDLEQAEAEDWRKTVSGVGRAFCLVVAVFAAGCASIFGFEFWQWQVGGPMASSMPWTVGGLTSSVSGLLVLIYYAAMAED